jgi:drug/metabolite transporter (DMT)-like permease
MSSPLHAKRFEPGVGPVAIALAASSWGLVPLIVRRSEEKGALEPLAQVVVVLASTALAAVPWVLRARGTRLPKGGPEIRALGAGLIALALLEALHVGALFHAYRHTSIATATLTHYLAPAIVVVIAPWLFGERLRFVDLGAALLGVVGLAVLLQRTANSQTVGTLGGALWGVASAFCLAGVILLNKRVSAQAAWPLVVFLRSGGAALLLVPFVPAAAWRTLHVEALIWLAAAGAAAGGWGGMVFLWGLRRTSASHAAVLMLFEPLVALGAAAWLLREPLSRSALLGALLVLASALLVSLPRPDSKTAIRSTS